METNSLEAEHDYWDQIDRRVDAVRQKDHPYFVSGYDTSEPGKTQTGIIQHGMTNSARLPLDEQNDEDEDSNKKEDEDFRPARRTGVPPVKVLTVKCSSSIVTVKIAKDGVGVNRLRKAIAGATTLAFSVLQKDEFRHDFEVGRREIPKQSVITS